MSELRLRDSSIHPSEPVGLILTKKDQYPSSQQLICITKQEGFILLPPCTPSCHPGRLSSHAMDYYNMLQECRCVVRHYGLGGKTVKFLDGKRVDEPSGQQTNISLSSQPWPCYHCIKYQCCISVLRHFLCLHSFFQYLMQILIKYWQVLPIMGWKYKTACDKKTLRSPHKCHLPPYIMSLEHDNVFVGPIKQLVTASLESSICLL